VAKRINHTGVLLPAPKRKTLDAMALAAHIAFTNTMRIQVDARFRDWDELSEDVQNSWYDGMRAAYGALAVIAGAKIEEVPKSKRINKAKKKKPPPPDQTST
jgi:hypothetical protein